MKFIASFSSNPFYGELIPIPTNRKLHRLVYDRVYLLDCFVDETGKTLFGPDALESELFEIYQSVSVHKHVHLVSSIDELKQLCVHPRYQYMCQQLVGQAYCSECDNLLMKVEQESGALEHRCPVCNSHQPLERAN
ncbi:hypothetical protein VTH8203_01501 [Vibrio thalassae]|uniref:Uncharacterized protein n=1 Tax=Vibrio thalassae TaxID=1243014 RepID=A0A240EH60_9VIBR|nr:hypothetical protein [Vibrio thalassae]SNX47886.1 hypothetical protein VTH8203_01501 [Vibrio thalassae]